MKLTGSKTTVERVQVDVDENQILYAACGILIKKNHHLRPYADINPDGTVEDSSYILLKDDYPSKAGMWMNPYYIGLQRYMGHTNRVATEEEKAFDGFLRAIKSNCK